MKLLVSTLAIAAALLGAPALGAGTSSIPQQIGQGPPGCC